MRLESLFSFFSPHSFQLIHMIRPIFISFQFNSNWDSFMCPKLLMSKLVSRKHKVIEIVCLKSLSSIFCELLFSFETRSSIENFIEAKWYWRFVTKYLSYIGVCKTRINVITLDSVISNNPLANSFANAKCIGSGDFDFDFDIQLH